MGGKKERGKEYGGKEDKRRRSCISYSFPPSSFPQSFSCVSFSFPDRLEADFRLSNVDPLDGAEVGVVENRMEIGTIGGAPLLRQGANADRHLGSSQPHALRAEQAVAKMDADVGLRIGRP
jgi:hypothetical protein